MRGARQEIRVPQLSRPISHYADAVRCGDFLFISGCVAFNAMGEIVAAGDVAGQTRQALQNMHACLDAVGMTFDNIVKVTVFLVDVNDRSIIDPIRRRFFGQAKPSSTLIGVKALAIPGLLVEIDGIAYDGP
jgi:2-iminobutanoate/2-iminopropanoate deaminase